MFSQVSQEEYKVFYYKNGIKQSEGVLKNGIPTGYWKSYYETGILKSEGRRIENKLDSIWTFYNEKGQKSKLISYQNGMRNGNQILFSENGKILKKDFFKNDTLNGTSYRYHENGRVKNQTFYKNGKKEGRELEWNQDSVLQQMNWYSDDVLQQTEHFNSVDESNKKQGIWKEFYKDYTIKTEKQYNSDSLDGYEKNYDEKGNLKQIKKYNNGQIVLKAPELANVNYYRLLDSTGLLIYEGVYADSLPVGTHYSYVKKQHCDSVFNLEQNKKKWICNWIPRVDSAFEFFKGYKVAYGKVDSLRNKTGYWTELHLGGAFKARGLYLNGNKTNQWTYYYSNGNIEQKGIYDKKGKTQGTWEWFYESGKPYRTEFYTNGKRNGTVVDYNEDGTVLSKITYSDNIKQGNCYFNSNDYIERGVYTNDTEDSVWTSYYTKSNTKRFEGAYELGEPLGVHKYYYSNGKLSILGSYKNGLKNGVWVFYNTEGEVYLTIEYKNDEEISWQGKKINTEGWIREKPRNNHYNNKL